MDKRKTAMTWYDDLDFIEQKKVNDRVKNYQEWVKSRSRTQASKPGGIELVHKMIMKGYIK